MAPVRLLRGALPALLLALASGLAAADGRLQVLAVEEPPVSFTGKDGKPAGYAVDVLHEIQRRVGSADPVEIAPESRVYSTGLRQPNVVMLSFSRTAEREASFNWITRIARKPWVFYGRHDSPLRLRTLDDVRRLRSVAVVTGDVRAQWLGAQGFSGLLMAEDHAQAIDMLLAGRVDALFSEPQGVAWYCHAHGCGNHAPVALWSPRSSDVYLLMSKHGTDPALAARWMAAAAAMSRDGTLERIGKRWAAASGQRFGVQAAWRDGVLDFCADGRGC